MRWMTRRAMSARPNLDTCLATLLGTRPYAAETPEPPPPHAPRPPVLEFLEEYPALFAAEVLQRLDPGDRAVLAQVASPLLAAVAAAAAVDSRLPRAGKSAGVPLKLVEFLGSDKRLAWAKSNGCPWTEATCARVAQAGNLEMLRWAREHDCPWDDLTCARAAEGGHLEVLRWARDHGCRWTYVWRKRWATEEICGLVAGGGDLDMLMWLREQQCPWDARTLLNAHRNGHTEVLTWAKEHGCPGSEQY